MNHRLAQPYSDTKLGREHSDRPGRTDLDLSPVADEVGRLADRVPHKKAYFDEPCSVSPMLAICGADGDLTPRFGDAALIATSPPQRTSIPSVHHSSELAAEERALDRVLHTVADEARRSLGAPRALVCLLEPETGQYRGAASSPESGDRNYSASDAGVRRVVDEVARTRALVHVGYPDKPAGSAGHRSRTGSATAVPLLVAGDMVGVIVIDHGPTAFELDAGRCTALSAFANVSAIAITSAQRAVRLQQSFDIVQRRHERLQQTSALEERLALAALDATTVARIAQTVADITKKPCSIHDAHGARIAIGRTALHPTLAPMHFDADVLLNQPPVAEQLSATADMTPRIVGPRSALGMHHRHMLVPMFAGEQFLGYLILMETGGRFSALDSLTARRCAAMAAATMSTPHTSSDTAARTDRTLDRRDVHPVELRRRGELAPPSISITRHTGAPEGPYLIAAIAPSAGSDPALLIEVKTAFEKAGLGHTAWYPDAGNRLLIVTLCTDETLSKLASVDAVREQVKSVLLGMSSAGSALCGLSASRHDRTDMVHAVQEACQTLRCVEKFQSDKGSPFIVAADDLGPCRLFLATTDRVAADLFAHERLGALLRPSSRGHLATLNAFFASSRNVRQTALTLGVHENTVRYRLSRVTELTGLQLLGNADDQLAAQISLLVLQLGRRCS
jgi:PucR C-terminal helix-turn-helix domain/GAF domain